jgi:hypothetical protein
MAMEAEELEGTSKIFGRNASEFLGTSVGAVLGLLLYF